MTASSINGQVAAQVWAELSRAWPKEAGIAGRRFVQLEARGLDPLELLHAISEHAVEGHHAAAINEEKARNRIARMREVFREEEKRSERTNTLIDSRGGLRPVSETVGALLKGWGIDV